MQSRWLVAAACLAFAGTVQAQQEPGSERRRDRKERPRVPPPTEADLGVPLYPGARFDGDVSAGMSSGAQRFWIFYSDDAPGKVLAFYEKRTGKKALEGDKDKYMIALKGKAIVPEHGVAIETLDGNPLFAGKGKTIITVARTADGE